MKIAIMQPYLFPYYGYYQMIGAVDKFVILDDVNFIKKGWINKNTLLNQRKERYVFTVPLQNASQNILIKDTLISDFYPRWKKKFYTSLYHFYGKNERYENYINTITEIMDKDYTTISSLSSYTLIRISEILEIDTEFIFSSDLAVSGAYDTKLMNICKYLGAHEYINSIGGVRLYSKDKFLENDIKLSFIDTQQHYDHLSVLHLLMNEDVAELQNNLIKYDLK